MKLLMFRDRGARRLGVARDAESDQVVDVAAASGGGSMPADILGVIDGGEAVVGRLRELASSASGEAVRRIADLELLAPFDPPRGNVLCIGRNYQAHAEETARANQTEVGPPTIFTKAITAINDPYGNIPINPAVSTKIDWEVELGVVIGSTGSNIKRANALEHVFGYTVVNDVTARDIQNGWGGQWFKGKSLDGSCPVGPWVLTKDEVDDVQSLQVQLRVNGVVKQDANTRDMIYPVAAIIEWLSVGMTLRPGMLIATGTPEGVGFARTPPEFLKAGDVMETEVMGVGLLRNTVVELPS